MLIDILYLILVILAVFRGYKRGLIVGIFSFVAVVIGLAAAMKLSTVIAGYIGSAVNVSDQWLPVVSFIVVFILIVLLIRLGANAIEKAVELATLGWLNKLGGIVLYVIIYTTVFSVVLFYAEQIQLLRKETIEHSLTYSFIQPWGPGAINAFAKVLPFFRDMFADLQEFFGGVSKEIPPAAVNR